MGNLVGLPEAQQHPVSVGRGDHDLTSASTSRKVVPMVPHLLLTPTIRPNALITMRDRSGPDLSLGNVGAIALKLLVVRQLVPWDCMMMNTHA